jgi:preprotein translocase subunit SecE
MARTRAERRARRQLQADGAAAAAAPPTVPPRRPTIADEPRRVPGGGIKRFVLESWGELKKVDWPGQNQVIQGTVVVLVACIVIGVFLWLNDLAWKNFIEKVLLR